MSAAATTEVEDVDGGVTIEVEDVDGGAPRGCCREVRQRPPPQLKTSMAGPQGVLSGGPTAATTTVEDIDGGPPGGVVGRSGSDHHCT
jgi:hypothetical protein